MAEIDEGSVIGNYRVVRVLGQGGMGTVYEVEHIELGTHYAIKTFTYDPEGDCGELLLNKFREEAKLLSRIKHPLVARAFDLTFDKDYGILYYVMDLVLYKDGESYSLDEVEMEGLDEDIVYEWFCDACEALDYVHSLGIVHRDVKLQNFLLNPEKHLVLSDFGISRIFGAEMQKEIAPYKTMRIKRNGKTEKTVLGTEHYIAPEVQSGRDATPAADAYSLGVMFFKLFTDKWADELSNAQVEAFLHGFKYRWYKVIPELVKFDPEQRPTNLSDLVELLQRDNAAQPTLKEPRPEEAKPTKKKRSKTKENLIAAACAMFAIGVLGTGGYFGWQHLEKKNAERDRQVAALAQQIRENEEAEKKAKAEAEAAQKAKEAEEKRIAGEKEAARKAKIAERERAEAARTKIEKQDPSTLTVRQTPKIAETKPEPEKPKEEFVVVKDDAPEEDVKDYGPIPDKKYTWLKGGNAKFPQEVKFLLANGATIELLPQKAATFYMSNNADDGRNKHKVIITRPFWMTKYCVTVDTWREFAPNDCEDVREIEKVVSGEHPICIELNRKQIDCLCDLLSKKYRAQLPKGYVFRLPTDAEWEYVVNVKETEQKYTQPGKEWWVEYIHVFGGVTAKRFKEYATSKNLDRFGSWENNGRLKGSRYALRGFTYPTSSGIVDCLCYPNMVLDILPKVADKCEYCSEEVDPLRWSEGIYNDQESKSLCTEWPFWFGSYSRYMGYGGGYGYSAVIHLVLGPDLISEQAWKNERKPYDAVNAVLPMQVAKFDPKKVKNKISRPIEVKLKHVGGLETIFCTIPKGKFTMTNVDGQEKSFHQVELTYPFWMSKFCVTAKEWREYAPNDFLDLPIITAEKYFTGKHKLPVCVANKRNNWDSYCKFLSERYRDVLPPGYVFRLPTEAEWEWAFVANEKGNARQLWSDAFNNCSEGHQAEFGKLMRKLKWPTGLKYTGNGNIDYGGWVLGRTQATGFGVVDIHCGGGNDVMMFDTVDANRAKDCWWGCDDAVDRREYIEYKDKEVDPVRWAGRLKSSCIARAGGSGRLIRERKAWGLAHIVIAPDLVAPLTAKEEMPYPREDFGGVWLGDKLTKEGQSSIHGGLNSDERFKRMVSLENEVVLRYDKGEDMRGFHTRQDDDSPWILLKLDQVRQINGLMIDASDDKAGRIHVWVSDDGKHERLVVAEKREMKRYRLDLTTKNIKAKYIRIGREPKWRKDWFYLDKILIYGNEK